MTLALLIVSYLFNTGSAAGSTDPVSTNQCTVNPRYLSESYQNKIEEIIIKNRRDEWIKFVHSGANFNVCDYFDNGLTMLQHAVSQGRYELSEEIIDANFVLTDVVTDCNTAGIREFNEISREVVNQKNELKEAIIKETKPTCEPGDTALHVAFRVGNLEISRLSIDKDANRHARNTNDITPTDIWPDEGDFMELRRHVILKEHKAAQAEGSTDSEGHNTDSLLLIGETRQPDSLFQVENNAVALASAHIESSTEGQSSTHPLMTAVDAPQCFTPIDADVTHATSSHAQHRSTTDSQTHLPSATVVNTPGPVYAERNPVSSRSRQTKSPPSPSAMKVDTHQQDEATSSSAQVKSSTKQQTTPLLETKDYTPTQNDPMSAAHKYAIDESNDLMTYNTRNLY